MIARPALLLAAALLVFLQVATAQKQTNVVSPEILPDHRVTFRIAAPKATEVAFTGDWITGTPEKMVKDEKGVWSVTLGPLPPASYIYSYTVDGVAIPDPVNPRIKLRARGSGSLFEVPGETPEMWQPRDVPHGKVEINWQRSTVLNGETRWFWVYTPPGYEKDRDRKYPVLYLLHGSNDTAAGWTTAGTVNFIFDNMIAEKKATPMVVVMPFGHAMPFGGGRGGSPGSTAPQSNTLQFEQYLLSDLMPAVTSQYRTLAVPESRAIAGMSMGGEQSLVIGFGHPELFRSIGALSPAMPRELADRWATALADPKGTNAKMKALWIACGRQDPGHLTASRRLDSTLQEHGVTHTYWETEGAHNYALWQRQIVEFLPLLFRPVTSTAARK
jgi:enterochelin esterase family protein